MIRYIYKLTFQSGKTYIGQRTYKGDSVENDKYLGSSTYSKRNPTDKILTKEIIIEGIKDKYTLNLLETICIMHEFAYQGKNCVNGTFGGYCFRYNAEGHVCSENVRKKMSESAKKSWTKERRKNASESGNYKRVISEEQKRRHNEAIRGTKKIHKGNSELQIKESDLEKYLLDGWEIGTLPFSESHKENLKKASKDKGKGYKALHKGEVMTRVPSSEVSKYLEDGWELGTGKKPWNFKAL